MLPQFEEPWTKIERLKSEMLGTLGSLTDKEREERPTPSDWSPLEILEHIVKVEEWTAAPNEEPIPDNARVTLKGRLFAAFANRFMRAGVRVPTDAGAEPSAQADVESLVRRWDRSRDVLKAKLQAVRPETLSRPIALHPLAGPLDAQRVLTLLDVHLLYHLRQLPSKK